MTIVLGVDGRRGGWALALVEVRDGADTGAGEEPGRPVLGLEWDTVPGQDADGLGRVLATAQEAGAAAVGIDCPIGLPADAWRPCDLLAKRRLGRASARVFLTPPREVLGAPSYPEARIVARQVLGKGISAQTYGLRRIVLAVDDLLRSRSGAAAAAGPPVFEVHPELSFQALAGRPAGDPLPAKRTPAGRGARIAALEGWIPADRLIEPPHGDDHLDALAAAWSAWRWVIGAAEILGGQTDPEGLPMRIVI